MAARPDMMKGFAELYKEGSKLNGMPVFQTVTMGAHAEGQGGAQAQSQQQEQQQADKPSIGSMLGGRFGGFGRRKKSDDQEGAQSQQGPSSASGTLMEMTMELSRFSGASLDSAKFEVPAGFKQVEPEAGHRRR